MVDPLSKREKPIKHIRPVIPAGHHVRGVSTLLDGHGQIVGQWQKSAKTHESREEILARLLRSLPKKVKPRRGRVRPPSGDLPEDLLAVYPMGDPHLGLLSWAPETGADYDLAIAERLLVGAIEDLVGHQPSAANALIVNLGDFFHADNAENRTSRAGHALDVDGRRMKILRAGLRIMVAHVDAVLARHHLVEVWCKIGNHDDESALYLSVALSEHFRNEPRVTVDLSPAMRHYRRFGTNLIGSTHGHTTKGDKLGAVMAAERPEDWGATRHRVWLCGHVHHLSRRELPGCTVETFRTLAPRDAWAAGRGYLAERDMNRIVLHKDRGEIVRTRISADALLGRVGP